MEKRQLVKPNSRWENSMRICESVIRIMTRFKWFMTRTSWGLFYIISECLNSTIFKKFLEQTKNYNFKKIFTRYNFLG